MGRRNDNRLEWCLAEVDVYGDDRAITKVTPGVRRVLIDSLSYSIENGGHQFGLLGAGRVLRGLKKAELLDEVREAGEERIREAAIERLKALSEQSL